MLFNTSANKDSFMLSTIIISFYFSLGDFCFYRYRNYCLNIGSCIESSTFDFLMFLSGKSNLCENMFCLLEGPISPPPPAPKESSNFYIGVFPIFSKVFLSSKQKTVALLIWGRRRAVAICLFSCF